MLFSQIKRNFIDAGYMAARVNVENIYVYLAKVEACAYVSVLIDCKAMQGLSKEDYDTILRQVRTSFFEYDFEEVNILGILCTENPFEVRELIDGFGEHWIVDVSSRCLIIYENQTMQFLNVREIIESALEGRSPSYNMEGQVKNNRNFFSNALCNLILISINILVFLGVELTGSSLDTEYMLKWGAMYGPLVTEQGQYYRLFTHMFLHFGIEHLLNNMLILVFMGTYLEKQLGKVKYLCLYILSGVLAGAASMGYNMVQKNEVVSAGASGAIFGVVGAMLVLVLVNKGRVEDLSVKQMLIFVALSLYSGFARQGVDNIAHIGGFITGVFLAIILYTKPQKEEQNT